ncbi:DUF4041 domain-containing protein [Nesterenkonia halophila]|uniref:DUF4041 domain-containing protein n=1 Tax=Nesterenkonia halophila TaxID=302044 RepID=UPI00129104FB|nr:DUF4041 domain-containing protein [Nesterenkonia halophila]
MSNTSPVALQSRPPLAESTPLFVTVVVLLVLAMVPVAGLVLAPAALVYVLVLRSQARRDARRAAYAEHRAAWFQDAAQRVGGMEIVQREHRAGELQAAIEDLDQQAAREEARVAELRNSVVDLRDQVDLSDYGLYDFENPAEDSVRYKDALKDTQARIKGKVRERTAATGSTSMQYNNSLAQGRKMVADMVKLLLRAFNAEAENAVNSVKAGHLAAAKKRLEKSASQVERLGRSMDISISQEYLSLRERELELTHAHLEAVKAAKEDEREARQRAREEQQAQKELAAAKAQQEKEVEHRRNVLARLETQGDGDEIARARAALDEAEGELSDVESTMANTRAGYVYVISNRGAFGPGIVKIGMTRRLNPDDRVKELSDASVPFNFDKHTMIFSEDAVSLEKTLHRQFADRRVNLVNMRREYFYTTPGAVKDVLLAHEVQLIEYHDEADALEYAASEGLRAEQFPETVGAAEH